MRFAATALSLALSLSLAACGGGSSRTTFARHPGAPVAFDRASQDAKAVEIADKVLAAAGGAATWTAAKQLRWQASIQHEGKEIIGGEQVWDRWNGRHRTSTKHEDGNIVTMRWLYSPSDNKVYMDKQGNLRKIEGGSEQALTQAKDRWEFDTTILFMPFLLEEPGTKLSFAGESQSEDGKVQDVLKVEFDRTDSNYTATYFVAVDRDTNMIARVEIQKYGKGDTERLGYGITGYQDAAGFKIPSSVQNIGMKTEIIQYSNLSVSGPDDELWTPPPLL